MDEPSDLIDFESLGCHPEPLGNPFQAESECSAAASNDTSSEHSTERRGLAVKCTDVGALSRTLEERIKRLEKAEIQQMLRNNESAQRQMIQDKKTRANEDLDRSVAMLLEYAGELKSSSCDLHVGHRFLSDTRLNAIQQRIRKDGAEVTSLEQHASTSTLNHDSFLVRPLSNEEEANECCQWLRDAGFPQYAKLYQDGCFPIDIDSVKRDHEFLDADSLYALFRRLGALNRCATMREDRVILRQHSESCNEKLIDSSARVDLTTNNYDEEEDQVAISSRWKYHRKSRTWSRIVDVADELKLEADVCRTHERLIPQKRNDVTAFPLELIPTAACNPVGRSAAQHINTSSASREAKSPSSGMPVQRSHSERIKERAKAFIKRMDIRLSSRRRRTREATSRERKGTEEPVIGEPVLISHFSASPRAMHMLPDGIATDLSPRCTPRLVVNARTRMHSSSPTNAVVGVGSPVRNARMVEINSRRRGMVLLSPGTESSSGDDSSRRRYEGVWSKRPRGVSCEPCITRHTMEQKRNARMERIYDRVASDDAVFPKGKSLTRSRIAVNRERNQHRTAELCSSPISYSSADTTSSIYRCGGAVIPVQRHARRSILGRDSTPLTSRLSPRRMLTRDERRIDYRDSARSPVKMVDAACETQSHAAAIVCSISDRWRLLINADGYYEHISDVGSNSSGSVMTSQTSSSTIHPSLYSHQTPPSPNLLSRKSAVSNVDPTKVNVGLQCEPVVQGCSRWFVAHNGTSQHAHSNCKSTGNDVGTNVAITQRRDSGVGASLSRSPSDSTTQRQYRSILLRPMTSRNNVNIHEVPYDTMCASSLSISGTSSEHRGAFIDDVDIPHCIDALSVREILRLRKLAFLKLSVLMERYTSSGIHCGETTRRGNNASLRNWALQKLLKRMRTTDLKFTNGESSIFGMPLSVVRSRSGLSLPRSILELMHFLSTNVADTVGIFRKNGVRSRIAELRAKCDVDPYEEVFPDSKGLDPLQVHDIADMLKQYFRELPEPLMTMEYSEVFTNIYSYFPGDLRLEALRYAVLLLPDENREALQTLLFFLKDISERSAANNMTARNLAVCFAPSLFHLSASRLNRITAARRHKTIGAAGMPTEREVRESVSAQECLVQMIEECTKLFIPPLSQDFEVVSVSSGDESEAPNLKETGAFDEGSYKSYLMKKANELLKENRDRWKGWIVEGVVGGVEISSRNSLDGHPLRYFRVWVDVEAPPKQLLMRLLKERNAWDPYTVKWRVVATLSNENCDVFQYVMNDTPSHPTRDVLVMRLWRTDIKELRGGCVLVERSVRSNDTQLLGGVSAVVLASRFLIEPRTGRSRVTYISRIDLRGRSNVWYGKVYGGMIARQLSLLRDSFKQIGNKADGPETKV